MTAKTPNSLLASILSGALGAEIKVIDLEIDPSKPIEDQLHAAAEKIAAEHREECDHCRAKHEAEQQANTHVQEKQRDLDQRITGLSKAVEAPYGTAPAEPEYSVLGYMAFNEDEPLAGTFDKDREVVKQGMAEFLSMPAVQLLDKLSFGAVSKGHTIRTIYTRTKE